MLRYLEPDCQMLKKSTATEHAKFSDLEFFAVLAPVKKTALNITELNRLNESLAKNAAIYFNEHTLLTYILVRLFDALSKALSDTEDNEVNRNEIIAFYDQDFRRLLARCDYSNLPVINELSLHNTVEKMKEVAEELNSSALRYLRKIAFVTEAVPYEGPLLSYHEFFIPLAASLQKLSFTPSGPIYLMIDDADNLSHLQTKIINSWVHTRSTEEVALKISTQLRYKTRHTIDGQRIDNPHDYSEVNISSIYTNDTARYKNRVKEVVKKRLARINLSIPVEDFFPWDVEQEEHIRNIGEKYKEAWARGQGRGAKATDDSLRYARPDYIRGLKGTSKSGSTYSYAGFDQLVHISSGVMRWFLEPAYHMYAEQLSSSGGKKIESISATIQNSIIRSRSQQFFQELDMLIADSHNTSEEAKNIAKLKNLIEALGGLFHQILISDRSERRVFSIAISGVLDAEVKEVLDLGEHLGFLHKASLGNKEGTGRTDRYILHRMLAPRYTLDPTSFAGYLFITNEKLLHGIQNPTSLLNRVKKDGVDKTFKATQGDLFQEGVSV